MSCAKLAHALSNTQAWNLIKGAVGRHADMVRLVSSSDVKNAYFAGKRVPPDLR